MSDPFVVGACPQCGALIRAQRPDTLDVAIAELEAALPEGWYWAMDSMAGGRVAAINGNAPLGPDRAIWVYGLPIVAAVRALIEKLPKRGHVDEDTASINAILAANQQKREGSGE